MHVEVSRLGVVASPMFIVSPSDRRTAILLLATFDGTTSPSPLRVLVDGPRAIRWSLAATLLPLRELQQISYEVIFDIHRVLSRRVDASQQR